MKDKIYLKSKFYLRKRKQDFEMPCGFGFIAQF